ncbi:MAG: hypothetical protein R6U17_05590 [Thermoplasmata archaeon]
MSWKLWNDIKFVKVVKEGWKKKRLEVGIKKAETDAKKSIVLFTVLILICLPLWGFSASGIAETRVREERIGGSLFSPTIIDPVQSSLGPTYDTDEVIQQMQEDPRWKFNEISERVDLDELTSVPGRIAVYTLKDYRIILTYTYLTPFPMVRAFGFNYQEIETAEGETVLHFLVEREETYLFPLNPGDIGKIANIA